MGQWIYEAYALSGGRDQSVLLHSLFRAFILHLQNNLMQQHTVFILSIWKDIPEQTV